MKMHFWLCFFIKYKYNINIDIVYTETDYKYDLYRITFIITRSYNNYNKSVNYNTS